MFRHVLQKGGGILLTLFGIVTLTFFLMQALPGDPFQQEQALPESLIRSLRAYYKLDQPAHIQYIAFLKKCFTGDLGVSLVHHGRSVTSLIAGAFPPSALLGLEALLIAVPGGIALGSWAALHRNRWQDHLTLGLTTLALSIPSFVLGTLLQYTIALKLGWLPVALWGTWRHTLLPAVTLASLPTASIARLTRSQMVEILKLDYMRLALVKGFTPAQAIIRHGLRNALLPILAYLGPVAVQILTGSFVVERIYGIPGLGQWLINSILSRDYPVIFGLVIFFSALLLAFTFFIEFLYAILDPRIRRHV